MNKHELGKQRIKEILGDRAETIIQDISQISPDFANYVLEFGYADLYARSGLSDKHRELAAVACLIGQKNNSTPLKAHLNAMLLVGWSVPEIIEVLILLIGFVGFPSCLDALMTLKQLLTEKSLA